MEQVHASIRRRIETKDIFGKKYKFKRSQNILVLGKRSDETTDEFYLISDENYHCFIEVPFSDLVFDSFENNLFSLPKLRKPKSKIDTSSYTIVSFLGKEEIAIGTLLNDHFPNGAFLLYNNYDPLKPVIKVVEKEHTTIKYEDQMIQLVDKVS